MKAILQSIKPQYCELIAAGKKTIEVRKTVPKLQPPFKCYIYCTKDNKVKFWKSKTYAYADDRNHNAFDKCCNGTVIGEFICDYIEEYKPVIPPAIKGYTEYQMSLQTLCEDIHLSIRDIVNYGKGKTLYGWHISNLVIYDEPKELSEFRKPCVVNPCINRSFCDKTSNYCCPQCMLTRPPQSWCYVEEKKYAN